MPKFKGNSFDKPWLAQKKGPLPPSFKQQDKGFAEWVEQWEPKPKPEPKRNKPYGKSALRPTPFETWSRTATFPSEEYRMHPDLTKCPGWAKYWAQDYDGTMTWFAEKPRPDFETGKWMSLGLSQSEVMDDWKNQFRAVLALAARKQQLNQFPSLPAPQGFIPLPLGWSVASWFHTLVKLPRLRYKAPYLWWNEYVLTDISCGLTSRDDVRPGLNFDIQAAAAYAVKTAGWADGDGIKIMEGAVWQKA